MICYAVIDTNVFVAALLTKNPMSPTIEVFNAINDGRIIPLYHQEIIEEYNDVLRRTKFHFPDKDIDTIIGYVIQNGIEVFPKPTGEILIDMDDLIFYEVAMEKRDDNAYLVTGNQKHYPIKDFIVTPAEMVEILRSNAVE